jgi:hypothetical protein
MTFIVNDAVVDWVRRQLLCDQRRLRFLFDLPGRANQSERKPYFVVSTVCCHGDAREDACTK